MSKIGALAILAMLSAGSPAAAEGSPGLAKQLLQGCLSAGGKAEVVALAAAVDGKPYSNARIARSLGASKTVLFPDASRPGEAQRTRTTVGLFLGWDLPGQSAGSLEYLEDTTRIDWVDQATQQPTTAEQVSRDRSCQISAPVANGRAIFELYESLLQDQPYGLLISSDRRHVSVFMFDPDRFDIELGLTVDTPLAGLKPDPQDSGMSRLVLVDGGPQFLSDVSPGVPIVRLTRAALLSGLDRSADMEFGNRRIEPVVQRLSALPQSAGKP